MTTQYYRLSKVKVSSLARFGMILGGVAMIWPTLICAVGLSQIIAGLRVVLEQWQASQHDALGLGTPVEFDFITLLGLEAVQTLIIRLDDQRMLVMLMIILGGMLIGGLLIAWTIILLGWSYNILAALTGGLELELNEPGK